jgi:flagellar hook protein FlgE
MGISSSMNAGIAGLTANGNKLSTISDNIANSETHGYKRSDVDFASMTVNAIGSSAAAGGGKLVTAGGVTTTAIWDVDGKAALESTSNSTDIAISGRGMLPVTSISAVNADDGSLPFMMTSTGSFDTDARGYLRTPSGLVLMGWAANPDGTVPSQPRDSASGLVPVQVNLSSVAAVPTTRIDLNANLPATETQAGASGDQITTTIEYYDNLGAAQNLSVIFTPSVAAAGAPQTNTWSMQLTDQATGLSAGTYDIVFSNAAGTAGQIASVTMTAPGVSPPSTAYDAVSGDMALDLGGQTIAIGVGSTGAGGPNHLSQLSSTFSQQGVVTDGSPAGTFTGLSIDQGGYLSAIYSSGFSKVLYQVPLVDVPNLNGLNILDNQAFSISASSGPLYLWDAGAGPTGSVEGFALELSGSDIATELTDLIRTQRAYSSNAKVIQTVDEMLQETTNLKR